jgi:hypothetical protein
MKVECFILIYSNHGINSARYFIDFIIWEKISLNTELKFVNGNCKT